MRAEPVPAVGRAAVNANRMRRDVRYSAKEVPSGSTLSQRKTKSFHDYQQLCRIVVTSLCDLSGSDEENHHNSASPRSIQDSLYKGLLVGLVL